VKILGANLVLSDFSGADLTGAELSGALLVNTRLEGTELLNVDIRGAVLKNVKFGPATELELEHTNAATFIGGSRQKLNKGEIDQISSKILPFLPADFSIESDRYYKSTKENFREWISEASKSVIDAKVLLHLKNAKDQVYPGLQLTVQPAGQTQTDIDKHRMATADVLRPIICDAHPEMARAMARRFIRASEEMAENKQFGVLPWMTMPNVSLAMAIHNSTDNHESCSPVWALPHSLKCDLQKQLCIGDLDKYPPCIRHNCPD